MLSASIASSSSSQDALELDGSDASVNDIVSLATQKSKLRLTDDPSVRKRIAAAAEAVSVAVRRGDQIYGVTTGFGGMAGECVSEELATASQTNLLSFLAAAAGSQLESRHVRAAMILRANVLLRGCSGVRMEIIERLVRFVQKDAIPVVRELGSIGASGDLIPLASIARSITGVGKSKVCMGARVVDSAEALLKVGFEPIDLLPKEGLALVNGTSFSSAIAANTVYEAENLMALSVATQALMLRALLAHESPFDDFVHQNKPHPGQIWSAKMTQRLLKEGRAQINGQPVMVQDRYSLRCLPQYTGSLIEGIAKVHQVVHTEMNAVSDNPLIDPESGKFYQSGNFLGQYLGVAMDDLRRYLGLMAKHLDVQIASLVAPEFNGGLSASLRGNDSLSYNMGLKGLQIAGNSIMPLLTYQGNPLVEHFPTHAEQFNQNINGLSWGAANLAWKSVGLFQQYMSVALIFAVQALDLRAKSCFGHFDGRAMLGSLAEPLYTAVCQTLEHQPGESQPLLFNDGDRWLEQDIEALQKCIAEEGVLVKAVTPVLDSFQREFLPSGS